MPVVGVLLPFAQTKNRSQNVKISVWGQIQHLNRIVDVEQGLAV
jgi:hypothetical protein